jgi:peptide-methionine (S)-S-oxide reductase
MKYMPSILTATLFFIFSPATQAAQLETAIFAGGCFWCVESDFESIDGVTDAVSGYIGGSAETAVYKKIGEGGTGHYEAVKITYDPSVISYAEMIDILWRSIDATDSGGQFCDRGDSYRSAIFTMNDKQFEIAQKSKSDLAASGRLPSPVTTKIINVGTFYPAEDYHQDYHTKSDLIISRYGPISKKKAYKKYRKACGRDARVIQLWGDDAFVIKGE